MEILIPLLITCVVVAVAIWLIRQIEFAPAILKSILITIVVLYALIRVWNIL